jgi:hypothetical protein
MRIEYDAYLTPNDTSKQFIELLDIGKVTSFLEPCRGEGSIYDKINCSIKTYCEIREDIPKDYLTKKYGRFDLIVTNPPFSLAQEFLLKSLSEADCVCYLMRLNFLGSQKRKALWESIGVPDKLIVLSKRPSFTGKGTDSIEYAWFCWDKVDIVRKNRGLSIL